MSRPAIAIALACAAMAPIAGCGDTSKNAAAPVRTVDATQIESQIEQQLSTSGAQLTKATCPTDVKSEAGATFKCSVTWSNGATGKVKVTETSLNHFTVEPVSGSVQVPGESVDKSVEKSLAQQGAPNAVVDCPQNVIVKVGSTVTCNVTSASGQAQGTVSFTFSSADGTVDSSSVKTSG